MDLSQLKSLGEIAGIGGIALGVTALVLHRLIGTIGGIPKNDRGRIVTFIAGGCFVIGALGIAAWTFGNQPRQSTVSTVGNQSPGIVAGKDATVSYGASPAAQPSAPATKSPDKAASTGTVRTQGNQSPGVVAGGNATIQYGSPQSAAPSSETKQ